ncbi:MAG TPA: Asp23/Gls24 family envelope stress response protein [Candidatus Limnocylindrales bacterium]
MTAPGLAVSHPVIRDVVRRAALEVPGVLRVGRGGPAWRRALSGSAVAIRLRDGAVEARVVVARAAQPLPRLAAEVRIAVGTAIERLLGLELGAVSVIVDGVGA